MNLNYRLVTLEKDGTVVRSPNFNTIEDVEFGQLFLSEGLYDSVWIEVLRWGTSMREVKVGKDGVVPILDTKKVVYPGSTFSGCI